MQTIFFFFFAVEDLVAGGPWVFPELDGSSHLTWKERGLQMGLHWGKCRTNHTKQNQRAPPNPVPADEKMEDPREGAVSGAQVCVCMHMWHMYDWVGAHVRVCV